MLFKEYYSHIERWTDEALDCYRRNCICKDCPVKRTYFQNKECWMKLAVLESVKQLGRPIGITKKILLKD